MSAKRAIIVSSAHLVSESAAELSEVEYGLIVANNAFGLWCVRGTAAADCRISGCCRSRSAGCSVPAFGQSTRPREEAGRYLLQAKYRGHASRQLRAEEAAQGGACRGPQTGQGSVLCNKRDGRGAVSALSGNPRGLSCRCLFRAWRGRCRIVWPIWRGSCAFCPGCMGRPPAVQPICSGGQTR